MGIENGTTPSESSQAIFCDVYCIYDLAIVSLGINPREMKTYAHTETSIQCLFRATLFVMVQNLEINYMRINRWMAWLITVH